MESLDPVPLEEYASMLTISMPNNTPQSFQFSHFDRSQNLKKAHQEHIYAQVTSNGQIHTMKPLTENSKLVETKLSVMPNKTSTNNGTQIRNPTAESNHASSAPDVRKQFPNLNLCQSNYGSLNVTKGKESVFPKSKSPTDSSVFSISGRRVVVSSGYNVKANNNKQVNNVREVVASTEPTNEWSSRSSVSSDEPDTKLQTCTDCLSLCLFVPGTVLCILSPWLLVPIYIIPSFSGSHLQTLIWITCIGSAILVFMGCVVGNMVWYKKGDSWKCLLHCGKGPKDHYWGDSLTKKRTVHIV